MRSRAAANYQNFIAIDPFLGKSHGVSSIYLAFSEAAWRCVSPFSRKNFGQRSLHTAAIRESSGPCSEPSGYYRGSLRFHL
jgi:hypothetical protein